MINFYFPDLSHFLVLVASWKEEGRGKMLEMTCHAFKLVWGVWATVVSGPHLGLQVFQRDSSGSLVAITL